MEKSPSIVNLAKALAIFQMKVDKIYKDASNPFFKSKYASLSNILEAVAIPLSETGLVISQHPSGDNSLISILIHSESGEYMQTEYNIHPVKNDPQATGSAITYARRYALVSILCLNVDEDDDANKATHGASTPQQAATQAERVDNAFDPKGNLKKWLNKGTKEYDGTVKKLQEGKTTLATVALYFKLNKEVRAELQQYEKKA